MYENINVRVYKCTSIKKYTGIKMYEYINVRVYK